MWLINPAEAFPDPYFRVVWLLELLALIILILSAMRFTRKAWICGAILLAAGFGATLPGWIYQLVNPDYIGALIDIPLLFMFPIMGVSAVWAIAAWGMRLYRSGRRRTDQAS